MDLSFLLWKKDEPAGRFVTRVIKGIPRLGLSREQYELFITIFNDESIPYNQRVEDAERLLSIDEKNALHKGKKKGD